MGLRSGGSYSIGEILEEDVVASVHPGDRVDVGPADAILYYTILYDTILD